MVVAEVKCAFPEDLYSALTARDVLFRVVEQCDGQTVRMALSGRDFPKLEKLMKQNAGSVRVLDRKGVLPFVRSLKQRAVLLAGLLGILMLVGIMQHRVWFIFIHGNQVVPVEKISQALEVHGVGFWASEQALDLEQIRNDLLSEMPELGWITIHTEGSIAEVFVRERTVKPVLSRNAAPANILAGKPGMIECISVTNGTAEVHPGDIVSAGDLLISGVTDLERTVLLTRASGEVQARTWNPVTALLPSNAEKKTYTGNEKRGWSLTLGKKTINFYKTSGISYREYDKIIDNADLTLPGNYVLPVRFSRVLFREYVSEPDPDRGSAEQLLTDAVLLQLQNRMQAGMILSKRLEVYPVREGTELTGSVECREEIGVAKDIQD
ncbi:MAG: sporulation protein YqfD [Oscillospiraceae bacterium]|nr:sporulation protein YqfD [Oscillospiraceae bacterium]